MEHDVAVTPLLRVRTRSPGVVLIRNLLLFGGPANVLILSLADEWNPLGTILVVFFASLALGSLVWSYYSNIETDMSRDGWVISRSLFSLRRKDTIDPRDVAELEMPAYSAKVVAVLRDGTRIVVANKYSVPEAPLPDLVGQPGVAARGPLRTVRQIEQALQRMIAEVRVSGPEADRR